MKLRNKTTGEISEFKVHKRIADSEDGNPVYAPFYGHIDEWEDYKEPKGSALDLMILTLANFIENEPDEDKVDLEDCKQMLEKLKAWKRLKDKGFRFTDYDYTTYRGKGCDQVFFNGVIDNINEIKEDLDLLFEGEE